MKTAGFSMAHSARYSAAFHVTRPVVPWETMAVLSESVTESPEGWRKQGERINPGTRRQGAGIKKKKIIQGDG